MLSERPESHVLNPQSRVPNPESHEPQIPNPESRLQVLANALLSLLLAPRCASCDEPLADVLAGPICERCWRAIRLITPPVCEGCGDPLPSWRAVSCHTARCPRCRRTPRAITWGRAIGEYDGALRQIIHAFKYDGRRSVAGRLGHLMRESAGDLLHDADCVVPVPLHPRRERARGFNQAMELARTLGLPVCSALVRVRQTAPQVDLPAARRHANVRGAFRLAGRHVGLRPFTFQPPKLLNAIVVLVDDVSTTGATLDACARVLKDAGVREVRALTGARVVRRDPTTRQQSA